MKRKRKPRKRIGTSPAQLASLLAAVLLAAAFLPTEAAPKKKPAGFLTAPADPVVVLNSTSVAHAADKLSATLRGKGAKIVGVGNVPGPRPAGLQILYAPGQRAQAQRLQALLAGRTPTIAPLDPVTAGAAVPHAKLVVVIG